MEENMEYLIEGEDLSKIRAGASNMNGCGGNDVYCKEDAGCGKWGKCIAPTTYGGCLSGILTYEV